MTRRPLDDAAFFDLMLETLPELEAYDAEVADIERKANASRVLDPMAWQWMAQMPFPDPPSRQGGKVSEFARYMQRYIDQLAEVRKLMGDHFNLPPDHPALIYGEELKHVLEEQRLHDTSVSLNRQWQSDPNSVGVINPYSATTFYEKTK